MPNRNGSGPRGRGPESGRGQGFCADREAAGKAQGGGLGQGEGQGILCRRSRKAERLQEENASLEKSLSNWSRRRGNIREK